MEGKTDKTRDGSPSTLDQSSGSASSTGPQNTPTFNSSLSTNSTSNQTEPAHESDPSLDTILTQLKLEEKPPRGMFTAVGAIFEHTSQDAEDVHVDDFRDWRAVLEHADGLNARGLTHPDALSLIRHILHHLWSIGLEDDLANATKILADLCREPPWRIPCREAGILEFFLEVIATEALEFDISSQTLRLIGNACADTDTNRELVVSQRVLPSIIKKLENDSLANLAVPVLYNICIDYEPAQEAVRENLLCPALIDLLARESFDFRPLLGYVCPLLSFSTENFDANQSPDYSVRVLLRIASDPEVETEDLVSLVNAILTHLKIERFQKILISHNLFTIPLVMIIRSFAPQTSASSPLSINDLSPTLRDPEEEEQLSSVRDSLIRALSDVSSIPEFGIKYTVDSVLVMSLLPWLSASRAQFQICSSIILGNLARSDDVCCCMVHDLRVHEILAATLRESSDLQVLHATIGFLRNLALPLGNKFLIGEAQVIEAVSRFWSMDYNPQLQHGTVSLVRQLLNGSLTNVQRLLEPLSSDPESPAHEKTYLSILLSLFDKTDQAPTKLEVGRIMAAIWRCLNVSDSSQEPNLLKDLLHRLYSMHANIARPLAMMVTQARWPVIRSEGWFALALMARSHEGSVAVNSILQQVEVFGALVETVTGQSIATVTEESIPAIESEPDAPLPEAGETRSEQETEIRTRNRENAMVLITELQRNSGHDISDIRRSFLEDLLRGRQSNLSFQELMLRAQSLE